jgi:putative Mg2+ transporter-C (MgtC) family protein
MTIPSDLSPPAEHIDELLDEAGWESFPASDPPAVTPMRGPVAPATDTRPRDGDKAAGAHFSVALRHS